MTIAQAVPLPLYVLYATTRRARVRGRGAAQFRTQLMPLLVPRWRKPVATLDLAPHQEAGTIAIGTGFLKNQCCGPISVGKLTVRWPG